MKTNVKKTMRKPDGFPKRLNEGSASRRRNPDTGE
jgi:hypothetical protein